MRVIRILALVVITVSLKTPVMAQTPLPSTTTADAAWTLLRELPLDARVVVKNAANEALDARVSEVYPDRVVLTDPRPLLKTWSGSMLIPRAVVAREGTLVSVRVTQMPRTYARAADRPRPAAAHYVAASLPPGARVRVRTTDGTTFNGRLVSFDDAAVTLMADGATRTVPFADVQQFRSTSRWKLGYTIAIVAGAVMLGAFIAGYGQSY